MNKWLVYTLTLAFATYWASNLLLWFPWSYSTQLGITLMLTVAPILWAYSTFLSLVTYPEKNLLKGASIIALILLLVAIPMDYIFFGLIRKAMAQLYHPTTLYGYAFLLIWPFILALAFKNWILRIKKSVSEYSIIKAVVCGMVCLGILTLIIIFRL